MSDNTEKTYIIDVDIVIGFYNADHPELLPMDRKRIAEMVGSTKQNLCDWKGRKTPKLIDKLKILAEIGDCQIEDFLIEKDG